MDAGSVRLDMRLQVENTGTHRSAWPLHEQRMGHAVLRLVLHTAKKLRTVSRVGVSRTEVWPHALNAKRGELGKLCGRAGQSRSTAER